ncbi:TIGR02646 family protein [Bacillus toyonensis]|nr:TIGR02646 family protein [Bacillus toyonensis]
MIYVKRGKLPKELDLTNTNSIGSTELAEAITYFQTQTRKFDFSAYKNPSVVKKLAKMFHGKCAYCESEIRAISYEEIEHFRPKGAIRIKVKENLKYPGYYWLAMKWDNLLVSCPKCNKIKGNFFPLVNENNRTANPNQISQEAPLLINPCEEAPEDHIKYTEKGYIESKTDKGKLSIRHYGLYRKDLTKLRERLAKDIFLKKRQILTGFKNNIYFKKHLDTDSEAKERLEEQTLEILDNYDFILEYINNPEMPYRQMVIQLTEKFRKDYGTELEELRIGYEKSVRKKKLAYK